jgi:ABC-type phosphate transport system substrate-binding protein
MKKSFLYVLTVALGILSLAAVASADVFVIVNKDNPASLDKSAIAKIWKGAMTTWPGGGGAISVVDQVDDSAIREDFASAVVGDSASNLKDLQAANVFSGKTVASKVVNDDSAVVALVSKDKKAIGYLSESTSNPYVKTILRQK